MDEMHDKQLSCPLGTTRDECKALFEDVSAIKRAVIGDPKFGVEGLVKQVSDLKKWRRKMDIRVAGVVCGISVIIWIAERLIK